MGGLGNQMFQVAAGYALSRQMGVPLTLDIRDLMDRSGQTRVRIYRSFELGQFKFLEDLIASEDELFEYGFGIKSFAIRRLCLKIQSRIGNKVHFEKNSYPYCLKENLISNNAYLIGFWQSPYYFKGYEEEVRSLFEIFPLPGDSLQILDGRQSVAVSLRRTDYVNNPGHSLLQNDYYFRALDKMRSMLDGNCLFNIFSDDIGYAKKVFSGITDVNVIDPKMFNHDDYALKFRIMSQCKHHIIANSTYSWWSAWLSKDTDKLVIAPKIWNEKNPDGYDIYPTNWHLI